MKRIITLGLILPLIVAIGACKHSSSSGDDQNGGGPGGGQPGPGAPGGGQGNPGDGNQASAEDLKKNPIDGIQPPTVILEAGEFTLGPVWHVQQEVLFFSTPLGAGALYRMRDDGSAMQVRAGDATTGAIPIGNTVMKGGKLITFEAKRVMAGGEDPKGAAAAPIANSYPGAAGAPAPFDTLKDGVARADGTIFMTDPGFFVPDPGAAANRIYRITPDGQVSVVDAFEDVPRPNGIALSPDQKSLYVGFSLPQAGVKPYVRKYFVNDDGTLGEHKKFVDIDPVDSQPDGIEVDQAGNVYVASKTGIQVFKQDGTSIGTIAVPEIPTGMAFAGKDLKTMYITTQGVHIYQVDVNVPGIVQ
jgi:gluconolactonase